MTSRFPRIDGERCVHALSAVARCEACAAACPHQALELGAESLTFNETACTGCGLCRPACPENAISFEAHLFDVLADQARPRAFAACAEAGAGDGPGVVPCLHGVTEREIGALAADGVVLLVTAYGDCKSCPNAAAVTLARRIAIHNRIEASRGSKVKLEEAVCDAGRWSALTADVKPARPDVDQGRRALFGLFLNRRDGSRTAHPHGAGGLRSDSLHRFVPHIAAEVCIACDACARVCPHGSIKLERDAEGIAYRIDAAACTGCNLCRDVCEHGAVSIAEVAPAGPARTGLREKRCVACGVPFHMTHADQSDASRCRICRLRPRPGRLFDVRS